MEDKVIKNIKIYFSFLVASLKRMMEYRVDCLVGMVSQISFQLIELFFIWIIFQNTDNIAGWDFEHLLLLYGVMMFSISISDLLFDSTYEIGQRLMRKGKFDTILLRPVHPLISVLGESETSTALGYMVLSILLIVSMLIKLQISVTFWLILKMLYFGFLGGLIIGGIQTIFSIAGFWTYKSNEVVWSVFQLHKLAEYPIEIYNKFIRILITAILPFAFTSYYPTLEYLNVGSGKAVLITPFVTIVIWLIAIKVWNWALNKYRSTGN